MKVPYQLEINVAAAWVESGAIWVTSLGEENTYYIDDFDREYYCKNL